MKNLVDIPGMQPLRLELERELTAWLRQRKDAFLPGVHYLEEDHLTHYLEARLPIHPVSDPNGQWRSTLAEGDPNTLASDPEASVILSQTMMQERKAD